MRLNYRHMAGHALMTLLLAGLLFRAFVPTGFMVSTSDETGALTIRLCGEGLGARYASFNPDNGSWVELSGTQSDPETDSSHGKSESNSGTCPFALAGQTDIPASDPFTITQQFGVLRLGASIYVSATHPRIIQAPLPARGPPLSI